MNYYVSLDEEYNELTLFDKIPSDVNVEENIFDNNLRESFKSIIFDLSFDESNILELKINGFKSKEIGILLDIKSKRVDNVYYNIKKKLSIKTLNK